MSKIAVVYWSGTGHTESMANAVARGVEEKGGEVKLIQCSDFDKNSVADYDAIILGCPAMGAEELEDSEFEPMFNAIESELKEKRVALFGSYGWGSGEWMESWEERCKESGINLAADSVICCEDPDDEAVSSCKALGAALV